MIGSGIGSAQAIPGIKTAHVAVSARAHRVITPLLNPSLNGARFAVCPAMSTFAVHANEQERACGHQVSCPVTVASFYDQRDLSLRRVAGPSRLGLEYIADWDYALARINAAHRDAR